LDLPGPRIREGVGGCFKVTLVKAKMTRRKASGGRVVGGGGRAGQDKATDSDPLSCVRGHRQGRATS